MRRFGVSCWHRSPYSEVSGFFPIRTPCKRNWCFYTGHFEVAAECEGLTHFVENASLERKRNLLKNCRCNALSTPFVFSDAWSKSASIEVWVCPGLLPSFTWWDLTHLSELTEHAEMPVEQDFYVTCENSPNQARMMLHNRNCISVKKLKKPRCIFSGSFAAFLHFPFSHNLKGTPSTDITRFWSPVFAREDV